MAAAPEASASTGDVIPALAWTSSPTAAAGAFGMCICTASGLTPRAGRVPCTCVVLQDDHRLGAAQREPDRDQQPAGVDLGRSGGLPQPPTQHQRHLLHVRQPAQLDAVEVLVEILPQCTADANGRVELVDERLIESADAALALQQALPGVLGIGRERQCVDATAVTTTSGKPSPVLNGAMPAGFLTREPTMWGTDIRLRGSVGRRQSFPLFEQP